ncbi:MAG: UDP-3-O-(3-hydroxymyristoyl)glucosamine N-acyltransferase [Gemmataceae bacterium]
MDFTVQHLAELVQGKLHGNPQQIITGAHSLEEARAGEITFVEDDRHAPQLKTSQASAAVVPEHLKTNGLTVIRVADPLSAFVQIARAFQEPFPDAAPGIDPRACVSSTARISPDATVQAFACIGPEVVIGARCRISSGVSISAKCRVGDDVTLYPHVVLYERTILGDRVTIHANAVIGADGFGYRLKDGRHVKVAQLGYVEIESDVEIGAGTTIDRGTFEATRIGAGTKIDNLVQIAHNCHIGRHNMLVSQVGVAGSARTGDYVIVAGQAGLADHVRVGDGVVVGSKSGVFRDVASGERVLGAPATSERVQKRIFVCLEKLPDLIRDVKRLKQSMGLEDNKVD